MRNAVIAIAVSSSAATARDGEPGLSGFDRANHYVIHVELDGEPISVEFGYNREYIRSVIGEEIHATDKSPYWEPWLWTRTEPHYYRWLHEDLKFQSPTVRFRTSDLSPGWSRPQRIDLIDWDLELSVWIPNENWRNILVDNSDESIIIPRWPGDANDDRLFNSDDLVHVFMRGKYETGELASWVQGDWNGDNVFDSGDLSHAFAQGWYEVEPAAVPEPSAVVLMLIGCCCIAYQIRTKS